MPKILNAFTHLLLSLLLGRADCAQADELRYKIGSTVFSEDKHRLVIHTVPPTQVELQAGGKPWPPVSLDESGNIYAGAVIIDADSAKSMVVAGAQAVYPHAVILALRDKGYQFISHGVRCTLSLKTLGLGRAKSAMAFLKDGNFRLATSDTSILALVTQFSKAGTVSAYQVDSIDLASCKLASVKKLGNPDLLVEIGSSRRGGWWITGATEQTLLRSLDGTTWNKVALPRALSSLVSSYAVDRNEIWLAASLANDPEQDPTMLVYTADGGKTWAGIKKHDALLKKLPAAWLEGQKRIAEKEAS
jgi:hypothetical protein